MKKLMFMFLVSILLALPNIVLAGDYQLQDETNYTRIKEIKVRWFDDKTLADQCAEKKHGEVFKNEGYHPYVVIYGARVLDVIVVGGMEMKVNICD